MEHLLCAGPGSRPWEAAVNTEPEGRLGSKSSWCPGAWDRPGSEEVASECLEGVGMCVGK